MKQLNTMAGRRHFFRSPRRAMRPLRPGLSPHDHHGLDDSPEMPGGPGSQFGYFPGNYYTSKEIIHHLLTCFFHTFDQRTSNGRLPFCIWRTWRSWWALRPRIHRLWPWIRPGFLFPRFSTVLWLPWSHRRFQRPTTSTESWSTTTRSTSWTQRYVLVTYFSYSTQVIWIVCVNTPPFSL